MVSDTPETALVLNTPLGLPVHGFTASGEEALIWWRRLRREHPQTGLWPILITADSAEYFASPFEQMSPAEAAALCPTLDGAAILVARGDQRLGGYRDAAYAAVIRSELRGEGEWRARPRPPGFGLPFSPDGGPSDVTVALVPASSSWEVPLALHYGGWNDYPNPAEHGAILRYFEQRYGAELVVLTGTTAEFAVSRPPTTRPDAIALAWEYRNYNDGEYDYYLAETLTDLAVSLLGTNAWRAWWD